MSVGCALGLQSCPGPGDARSQVPPCRRSQPGGSTPSWAARRALPASLPDAAAPRPAGAPPCSELRVGLRLGSKHSALRARSAGAPQEGLVAKARALAAEGLTARLWAGGYGFPPATATGGAQRDVCLLERCVGVGEVAVSDHRGSAPRARELGRLARHATNVLAAVRRRKAPVHRHRRACNQPAQRPAPGAVVLSCARCPGMRPRPLHAVARR